MVTPEDMKTLSSGAAISDLPAFSYYKRLARVRGFVLEHYSEPISLALAAQVAGMERTAFSDFFHRKTGVCFRDYVAAIRVARAMELMAGSNLPVREVGKCVGYRSVRTFERVFLRTTGYSPIHFKISYRHNYRSFFGKDGSPGPEARLCKCC